MSWLNPSKGTLIVRASVSHGDAVAALGSLSVTSDSDEMKTYAVTYDSDVSATELSLGNGMFEFVNYIPRVLSAAELESLTHD